MELWADISGFEGYQISSEGRLRSCRIGKGRNTGTQFSSTWHFIKTFFWKNGKYPFVVIRDLHTKKYRTFTVHKLIWECFKGPIPEKMTIDHIDRDPSNCTLQNLRLATYSQNNVNRKGRAYRKYKGVYFQNDHYRKNPWRVCVNPPGGKMITIGYFESFEKASEVYNKEVKKLYGEFALLNASSLGGEH